MKKKYSVIYKIKKDYPEIDKEGNFDIYASDEKEAEIEAIREIKRKFFGIEQSYSDDEIKNMFHIHHDFGEIFDECYICQKLFLDPDEDYITASFRSCARDDDITMEFCMNCWSELMEYLTAKKFNIKTSNEN
jgi:hypothetical protein